MATVTASVVPKWSIDLSGLYRPGHETSDDGGLVNGPAAHTAVSIRHLAATSHVNIAMTLPDDPAGPGSPGPASGLAVETAAGGLATPWRLLVPREMAPAEERVREFHGTYSPVRAVPAFDGAVALLVMAVLGHSVPGPRGDRLR